MQCYTIIGKDAEEKDIRCPKKQEDAFCSPEHHEAWAKENYKRTDEGRIVRSVEYMQKRLREMGKESSDRQRKTLFD